LQIGYGPPSTEHHLALGTLAMPDRKHDDQPKPKGHQDGDTPTYHAGGGGAQQNQGKPQEPVKGQSQKSQIAQYFKSQGRQPDDVVWSVNGLNLRLSDLD
jgi:hypothetical protein